MFTVFILIFVLFQLKLRAMKASESTRVYGPFSRSTTKSPDTFTTCSIGEKPSAGSYTIIVCERRLPTPT